MKGSVFDWSGVLLEKVRCKGKKPQEEEELAKVGQDWLRSSGDIETRTWRKLGSRPSSWNL